MDLVAFSTLLVRRGWLMLAGGALGALAGLVLALTRPAAYEATSRIALAPARPADYGQTQATKELMQSMMEDIRTYDMADAVGARLGDEWLAARGVDAGFPRYLLDSGQIGVANDINVYELQVTARSPDPAVAVQVSEKWAETFVDRRHKANLELDRDDRIEAVIRDEPVPRQYAPRRKLMVGAGAVAGFGLGALLMLLLEYLESAVVRSAREAERIAGAPVVGIVPPGPGRRGPGAVRQGLAELGGALAQRARQAWPVAVLAVLGAVSALAFSLVQVPQHRARTRIALEPANTSNWGNTQAIREIMRGYTEDIGTRTMAREVNARLALDLPLDDLLAKLNVAEQVGVYEITVDVFDPDPDVAASISRTWASVFIEVHRTADEVRAQRDRTLVRLRDATRVAPWSPRTAVNTAAGAALGALVGVAAVLALGQIQSGLVWTAADAGRAAGAPLLGAVPPAHRRRRRTAPGGTQP